MKKQINAQINKPVYLREYLWLLQQGNSHETQEMGIQGKGNDRA